MSKKRYLMTLVTQNTYVWSMDLTEDQVEAFEALPAGVGPGTEGDWIEESLYAGGMGIEGKLPEALEMRTLSAHGLSLDSLEHLGGDPNVVDSRDTDNVHPIYSRKKNLTYRDMAQYTLDAITELNKRDPEAARSLVGQLPEPERSSLLDMLDD